MVQSAVKMGAELINENYHCAEYPMFPGSESMRTFRIKYRGVVGGPGFFWLLSEHLNSRGIKIIYNTPAKELIVNEKREIIGVIAGYKEKEIAIKAKRAVILTCGGFEWNEEMKLNYLRGALFYFYCNPGNTGDGIKMAQKVGAALWHMNTISGRVIPKFPRVEPAMMGGTPSNRFILVDKYGKRFVRERPWISHSFWLEVCYFDTYNSEYPRIPCYSIFDEVARRSGPVVTSVPKGALVDGTIQYFYSWSKDNVAEIEKGWIIKGNSISDLAMKLGVESGTLKDTIRKYNLYCKAGKDPQLGRMKETLIPIDTPPYYALEMYPGGPNTQGGPKRNAKSQIIDSEGKPIPRLYAAGELGSIYGFLYPAPGGNISELIAFGRIAGKKAAEESNWC